MSRVRVADLKSGMKLNSRFIIKDKRLTPYKGKPGHFLTVTLADSSGEVDAKIWDKAEDAHSSFNVGDLIEIKGDTREYNNNLQVNIGSYRICPESEFNSREYLPTSPRDIEEMLSELMGLMETITNKYLKGLLYSFFQDRNWLDRFCASPAAKINHQAYLGGLLEHTLNLAKAASTLVVLYPRLDRNLLLAGAILHDIGKIEEYSCDRNIDFTDEGRLLGHIVIAVSDVDRRIRDLGEEDSFPVNLRIKLLHIITSHHGLYEWQSPKRPKILEAAVIHLLDTLDSVVDTFSKVLDEGAGINPSWSLWNRSLERYIYLK